MAAKKQRQYVVVAYGRVVARYSIRRYAEKELEFRGNDGRVGYRELDPETRTWSEVRYGR